jgi:hypothetical protein
MGAVRGAAPDTPAWCAPSAAGSSASSAAPPPTLPRVDTAENSAIDHYELEVLGNTLDPRSHRMQLPTRHPAPERLPGRRPGAGYRGRVGTPARNMLNMATSRKCWRHHPRPLARGHEVARSHRMSGRAPGYPGAPPRNPACGFPAPGSSEQHALHDTGGHGQQDRPREGIATEERG